jgi:hypothetical protein
LFTVLVVLVAQVVMAEQAVMVLCQEPEQVWEEREVLSVCLEPVVSLMLEALSVQLVPVRSVPRTVQEV